MTNAKSVVKNVAAGTLLGGGLLVATGLGAAQAQPLQNTPDGLVDVARTLGRSRARVFLTVVLPHVLPAAGAGAHRLV